MSTQQNASAADEAVEPVHTPIKGVDPTLSVEERFTDNAIHNILPARYLLRDDDGNLIEEPGDLFERVARNVAKAEYEHEETVEDGDKAWKEWAGEFQELMEQQLFMPNSPTLMNAGSELQQLSACFVVEPKDDMHSIFESAKEAALIFKSGGGVGYTFSHLRPKGTIVSSTGGESSGPLSFMELFDTTCNTVKQGGKRRGAQMAILRCDHADIGRFACSKRNEGDLDNFNISVAVTDEFKQAVEADADYRFYDPQSDYDESFEVVEATANFYNPEFENNPEDWEDAEQDGVSGKLVKENFWRDYADDIMAWDPEQGEKVSIADKWEDEIHLEAGEVMELPARFIFDILIDGAWRNGEPGLFYLDETNRQHSFNVEEYPEKHKVRATNPCAEQPLSNFEACNLGHINLSLMVSDQSSTYSEWAANQSDDWAGHADTETLVHSYVEDALDRDQLDRVIESGTRFLDNVVTMSEFPLDKIDDRVEGQRKIGLGIMGFAQMLFQMGIPYGSPESYEVARAVMKYIDKTSKQVSHELAEERGVFGYWDESKYANPMDHPEWFEGHVYEDPEDHAEEGFKIRNHNTTTIAPTGTTSMLADTTGGCEPAFNVINYKNVGDDIQGDDMLVEFDDYFAEALEANGYDAETVKQEAIDLMESNEFEGPHDLSIPDRIADIFVTTNDLSSHQHTDIQRAFQEFVDSGISKTVNMPNDARRDDVYDAYMRALDTSDDALGQAIKGLTVYRDGSRDEQVKTVRRDNKLDEDDEVAETLEQLRDSGELSDVAAKQLGLLDDDEEALCPDCGTEMDDDGEGCTVCPSCFYSPCA